MEFLKMKSFLVFLIFLSIWGNNDFINHCDGDVFTLKIHHRLSEPVKKWSQGLNKLTHSHFPAKGSVEYFSQLAYNDRIFRGRRLSDAGEQRFTFSDGNSTLLIKSLGFLHYTTVSLGTPGKKFMVALDTGSDLFWVPCDCRRCASIDNTAYSSEFKMSIYTPKESSTSKEVDCNHSMCTDRHTCPASGGFGTCPYLVSYMSSQTSTSGILMEDLLHLESEERNGDIVDIFVTFGCGQVQSGSFLDTAAPNGLFGLGLENMSVPSILSREGYTANSFSMCFGRDGHGRISFGDKGSFDQKETPFYLDPSQSMYKITVTQLRVGASHFNSSFVALFDSGTSFTYLVDPHYTRLTERFHAQTKDARYGPDHRLPFEYCYHMSPDANTSLIPSISLTMKAGGQFFVDESVIVLSSHGLKVYCLTVIRGAETNIIGQNFMTGYRIVFDREKLVLGWKKSDCYDMDESSDSPLTPLKPGNVPPAVAAGVGSNHTSNRSNAEPSLVSPRRFSFLTQTCLRLFFSFILLPF